MINSLLKPFEDKLPQNNRLEQIWVQAKVNFLKRYYGSFAGVFWAFINPMAQFLIYYTVFSVIITTRDENRAVALMLGLIMWAFVQEGANHGMKLLQQKRYIIENLPFNKRDMYISSMLGTLFSVVINFLIYVIFAIIFGVTITKTIFLFPLIFFNLIMFVVSLQLIMSVAAPIILDVTHIWDKGKLALFWMSGVVFPMHIVPTEPTNIRGILLTVNPFAGIFMNIKNICVYNRPIDWAVLGWDYFLGIIFLIFSIWIAKKYFHLAVEKI